jgi:hypothetical protein
MDLYPEGDNETKITIQKIDETIAIGEIKSIVEQSINRITVGRLQLKNTNAGKKIVNSGYRDCVLFMIN